MKQTEGKPGLHGGDGCAVPAAEDVLTALERVVSNTLFAGSERLSRFLKYVVEQTVQGRGGGIKEYSIGVEVYRRGADFDPKTDAIVRVEAGRLRSKLRQYYSGPGAADMVRIEVPRGGYTARFAFGVEASEQAPAPMRVEQAARARAGFLRGSRRWALASGTVLACASAVLAVALSDSSRGLLSVEVAGTADTEGLQAQITHKLSLQAGLSVPASPRKWPGRAPDAVLKVRLERQGDTVRAGAILSDTKGGPTLWSEEYSAERADLSRFTESVATLIARTVWLNFGGLSRVEAQRRQRRDPAAIRLYAKGQEEWLTRRKHGALKAVNSFQQVVERDAQYAEAYAGLASAAWFLADFEQGAFVRRLAQARSAVAKSLALDSRVAEAHATYGNILLFEDRDWPAAERELLRAARLHPGVADHTRWYALVASIRGHQREALSEMEYARLVNPASHLLLFEAGRLSLETGNTDAAERFARRALDLAPHFRPALHLLGLVYQRRGRNGDAIPLFGACGKATEWDIDCEASLLHARILSGARVTADEKDSLPTRPGRALVWLASGQPDRALELLEESGKTHEREFGLACHDFRFAALHQNPRFQQAQRTLGLLVHHD